MSEFPGSRDKFVDEDRVWIDQNDHATITLHGTGGNPNQTADQLGNYFETTPLKTSVHYGVDRNGNCDQYVWEKDGCGGEGILEVGHDPFWDQYSDNPNWHGFGVETENDLTNSLPLTDPQKAMLFRLVAYLKNKYGIPLSNIKGHFTLEPVNRVNCPGPNFPWDELFAYLNNGGQTNMATIPTGWTDDTQNQVLTAPNGHHVIQGFRGWVLTHQWDPNNMPLEEVVPANPVEDYYSQAVNAGTRQLFTYCELAWTSARGVYVVSVGNELKGVRKDRDTARAEVALLSKQINDASQSALGQQVTALQSQVAALQQSALVQENTTLKAKIVQAVKDLS